MSAQLSQAAGPSLGRFTGRRHQAESRSGAIFGWLQLIPAWISRHRQRKALSELNKRLLDDIGVPYDAALREAARPFWR